MQTGYNFYCKCKLAKKKKNKNNGIEWNLFFPILCPCQNQFIKGNQSLKFVVSKLLLKSFKMCWFLMLPQQLNYEIYSFIIKCPQTFMNCLLFASLRVPSIAQYSISHIINNAMDS